MAAVLNHDVLWTIVSMVDCRQSLLSFALTCRAMRNIIIPTFLFSHVAFPARPEERKLLSFCHALETGGSIVGRSVRHFDLNSKSPSIRISTQLARALGEAAEKMTNIRSAVVPFADSLFLAEPRFPRALVSQAKLRCIELHRCSPASLELVRDLAHLHVIRITAFMTSVTPDSALAQILLNSRTTLRELSLRYATWSLSRLTTEPLPPTPPDTGLVWPHVETLDIRDMFVSPDSDFDPIRSFPVVRHLSYPASQNGWVDRFCSSIPAARLDSLEGDWEIMQAAFVAGAKPQRAVITSDYPTFHGESYSTSYLPSSLRQLHLRLDTNASPHRLERLADVTPTLTHLYIDFHSAYSQHTLFGVLTGLIVSLSGLPLTYLRLTMAPHSEEHDMKSFLEAVFIPLAESSLPLLRTLSLDWFSSQMSWRKTKGTI
ncbi:hypothetical protein BOTBODRAFT_174277 [Botryobasidium botryosum FD-172 SS1]|uniref:F-box domain-containing protein n=1 Tax=Botryobasidium botryosum (strain FD-172 SS1) TaxID=930990 RepID=A0A067MTA8_BOTB1|nr:hypothetical protein BOTBODRAFT_174277 [Botryobasidium botryosum FD-172 SS1]